MKASVDKWGNSLGIRIPSSIVQKSKLKKGAKVNIEFVGNKLIISTRLQDLDALLSRVTPQNLHHDTFDDSALGGQEW